ncbi:TM2 domain containing protein [Trichomonas vaginalis G3]|uniref:TM2 domain containing protein n=1 Tax=Trichomonas vaginalis (strain ATCC PRA-98 / G3) TaxID=412133 RepID=A2DI05_TRIV3|nr:amyloid-beta binding [Trichomonas vaginalis G3]EAY19994.1 TM2 domain containing protein [Trichomonas vaginalis G3]KAI5525945.1 amyloid-beta binding [Trichomonas vaginalis G3]|eukprot:XP_001580980.1 TM2 domain containing protein [Trichomonas vaginalis G3]
MIILSLIKLANSLPPCASLNRWYLDCNMSTSKDPFVITCPSSGYYEYSCTPVVECEGETTVKQKVLCYPTDGKSPAIALTLSVVLGFLGADRFYLGYPTIGIFKMFTGGFFGLGWYIDIFLIALRIAKPAQGNVYRFEPNANFRIRLPGEVWM